MPPETADQAAPQGTKSIVDQLAKGFDHLNEPDLAKPKENIQSEGDDAPVETDDSAEPGDGLEEVEYEGQTYKVPPALKEAIITKADYTRKSQDVANQARNVELMQEAMKAAQSEQAFVGSIQGELGQLAQFEAKQRDLINRWPTLSTDEKQEVYLLDHQMKSLNDTLNGKRNEFRQAQLKVANDLKAKAADVVRKSIPNFNEKVAQEIAEYAVSQGYTRAEVDAIWDPRHARTLWEAMQYSKLSKAAVKTPKVPAVVKPGASSAMPAQVKTDLNLRKAQGQAKTSSDKAKIIEQRLMAGFAR